MRDNLITKGKPSTRSYISSHPRESPGTHFLRESASQIKCYLPGLGLTQANPSINPEDAEAAQPPPPQPTHALATSTHNSSIPNGIRS